jgi:hypothetical protein
VVSQLLTLFITPVIYLYFDRAHQWWLARRQAIPRTAPAELGRSGSEP